MIELRKRTPRKGVHQKDMEVYKESEVVGLKAKQKEAIITKVSVSDQLNAMRKAIIAIGESAGVDMAELNKIDEQISSVIGE
jgi:hypothetical protein